MAKDRRSLLLRVSFSESPIERGSFDFAFPVSVSPPLACGSPGRDLGEFRSRPFRDAVGKAPSL
jgi:hypothetical protein